MTIPRKKEANEGQYNWNKPKRQNSQNVSFTPLQRQHWCLDYIVYTPLSHTLGILSRHLKTLAHLQGGWYLQHQV